MSVFQNKVLRLIVNAPWYVPNTVLHTDLQIPTVKAEITNFSTKYRKKLTTHPNELIPALLEEEEPRRLKRLKPTERTTRFS
jgi:murein L,D-transpeptidase YcbB/YkuD